MQFTVALPMIEPSHSLPLAKAAEAAGYGSVAVPESVFYPDTERMVGWDFVDGGFKVVLDDQNVFIGHRSAPFAAAGAVRYAVTVGPVS